MGIARALCRRGRPACRHSSGRGRRQRDHAARARAACGGACRDRAGGGASLLHQWLRGRLGRAAHSGGAHRGRPRRWLRPKLARPEDQLRGHRRPVGARRSRRPLCRSGARLRSQAKASAIRRPTEPGPAAQSECHVPDRRRRGNPSTDQAGHPGVRARARLLGWTAPRHRVPKLDCQ